MSRIAELLKELARIDKQLDTYREEIVKTSKEQAALQPKLTWTGVEYHFEGFAHPLDCCQCRSCLASRSHQGTAPPTPQSHEVRDGEQTASAGSTFSTASLPLTPTSDTDSSGQAETGRILSVTLSLSWARPETSGSSALPSSFSMVRESSKVQDGRLCEVWTTPLWPMQLVEHDGSTTTVASGVFTLVTTHPCETSGTSTWCTDTGPSQ